MSGAPRIVRDAQFSRETFRRIATRYLGEARARVYFSHAVEDEMVVIRLTPGSLRTWDFADDAQRFGFGSA